MQSRLSTQEIFRVLSIRPSISFSLFFFSFRPSIHHHPLCPFAASRSPSTPSEVPSSTTSAAAAAAASATASTQHSQDHFEREGWCIGCRSETLSEIFNIFSNFVSVISETSLWINFLIGLEWIFDCCVTILYVQQQAVLGVESGLRIHKSTTFNSHDIYFHGLFLQPNFFIYFEYYLIIFFIFIYILYWFWQFIPL